MKSAALAWLATENMRTLINDWNAQRTNEQSICHSESLESIEAIILACEPQSLEGVEQPALIQPATVKPKFHHKLESSWLKLLRYLNNAGRRSKKHLLQQSIENSGCLGELSEAQRLDLIQAQKRKAELERIERYKCSGL